MLIDVRLFEPKDQQGAGYSRCGADGAQAERQMVWCALQVFLCMIVHDCCMKDGSMDLTLLTPPRTPYGGRKNHPSCGLCSIYSSRLNVQSVWTKIGTSSVPSYIPLFHHAGYGYNPFALLALRKMLSETLCRERGCTHNNSVAGTTQSATSVPLFKAA